MIKTNANVGDIVKIGHVYDFEAKTNLYGHIGMVINSAIPEYELLYSKCGDSIRVHNVNIEVLTDEQVANINLTDYFSEDDVKKYRGNRDEEPLKPSNPMKPVDPIVKTKELTALSYQVGGSHYKDKAIQPVEYITANKLDFLEGCIVKRITRHRDKLGALDIAKARQECDLILQLEYGTTFDEVMSQKTPKSEL